MFDVESAWAKIEFSAAHALFTLPILLCIMTKGSVISTSPRDIAAIDLDRVLTRLEQKILSTDADPRLQHSSFERIKTSAVRRPPPLQPLSPLLVISSILPADVTANLTLSRISSTLELSSSASNTIPQL